MSVLGLPFSSSCVLPMRCRAHHGAFSHVYFFFSIWSSSNTLCFTIYACIYIHTHTDSLPMPVEVHFVFDFESADLQGSRTGLRAGVTA